MRGGVAHAAPSERESRRPRREYEFIDPSVGDAMTEPRIKQRRLLPPKLPVHIEARHTRGGVDGRELRWDVEFGGELPEFGVAAASAHLEPALVLTDG